MEFNANFTKEFPSHSSFPVENSYTLQIGNDCLPEIPSWPSQICPPFDQSSIRGTSSNPSLGFDHHFDDPFDQTQGFPAYEFVNQIQPNVLVPLGSIGSSDIQNHQITGIPSYHLSRNLFQAPNGQGICGSADPNPLDEIFCVINEVRNQIKADPKRKKFFPSKGKTKILEQSNSVKGQWSHAEDSLLIDLVKEYGDKSWSHIATRFKGRVGKQCRERWHNHLKPDIKKTKMSEEEEFTLITAHRHCGNKWAKIAKYMPGRTENSVKNHFNAAKRRFLSNPHGNPTTLLEEYIKSLSSEALNSASPENPSLEPIVQIADASADVECNGEMFPNYDSEEALRFVLDESEGYIVASIFEELPESNAPNLVKVMGLDVENDAEFLECAGWNLSA